MFKVRLYVHYDVHGVGAIFVDISWPKSPVEGDSVNVFVGHDALSLSEHALFTAGQDFTSWYTFNAPKLTRDMVARLLQAGGQTDVTRPFDPVRLPIKL